MAGGRTRLGLRKETGPAQSDHTGSVTRLRPCAWIRTVACPTTEIRRASLRASGFTSATGAAAGQGVDFRPPRQRIKSRTPLSRVAGAPLKNRTPSK